VPDEPFQHLVRAGALAQLGRVDEAREAAARARRLAPFLKTSEFGARFVRPEDRERAQAGLRKAGF
jgi:predicted RNA polymerase sigma factor